MRWKRARWSGTVGVVLLALSAGSVNASVPTDDDLSAARNGLERIAANVAALDPAAPAVECPLLPADEFATAFELAGVDANPTLMATSASVADPLMVKCRGQHVGATGTSQFPELDVQFVVGAVGHDAAATDRLVEQIASLGPDGAIELPPAPPGRGGVAATGACDVRALYTTCVHVVETGDLVFGLVVTDTVFIDEPTMTAISVALIPPTRQTLTSGADFATGLRASIDEATVGLIGASLDSVEIPRRGCPTVDDATVNTVLAEAGLDVTVDGWRAERVHNEDTPTRITCATSDELFRVDVASFESATDAADFVASVGHADGGSASDLDAFAETVGSCTTVSGFEYCTEWFWHHELAIGITLFGAPRDIGPSDARDVLTAIVPSVVATLADA